MDVGASVMALEFAIPNSDASGNVLPPAQPELRTTSPARAAPRTFRIDSELKTHWIAELYSLPPASGDRGALAQSITRLGKIIEPVTLYEGELLDGVVRYQVATERGIPCFAINFEETDEGIAAQGDKEAVDRAARTYLFQKNVVRRHYSQGQRAAIAAQLTTMRQGARTDLEPSAALREVSQEDAAMWCHVSVRSVQNAQRIYREGTPDDVDAMLAGTPLEQLVSLMKARERARKAAEQRNNCPHLKTGNSVTICGDALTELCKLHDKSVQLIITSPPYLGLRDYHMEGQIGLENDPWLYIQHLVEVFREARRVLKEDGTLFIVIGDSYAGSGKGPTGFNGIGNQTNRQGYNLKGDKLYGFKRKELILVHAMLFSDLQADGWYGRQILIWNKLNCMPESVTDRFTNSHEYILFMTRSDHYYFDAEVIKEPALGWGIRDRHHGQAGRPETVNETRNKRSVLTLPTRGYPGVHFATFPEELIEPFVLAGSRKGDVVLDMFLGSGTTAVVAKRHGREYVGIDLNPDYVRSAELRIAEIRERPLTEGRCAS